MRLRVFRGAVALLIGSAGAIAALADDKYALEFRATLPGHPKSPCCVQFAPVGRRLVSFGLRDGATKVWDTEQQTLVRSLDIPGSRAVGTDTSGPRDVFDAAITRDGRSVLESSCEGRSDYKLRKWDVEAGTQTVIWESSSIEIKGTFYEIKVK